MDARDAGIADLIGIQWSGNLSLGYWLFETFAEAGSPPDGRGPQGPDAPGSGRSQALTTA